MRPGLFVFDVTGLGIDHVEEPADVLPVLLHWPPRCPARAESVALVGPAHPVIVVAAAFTLADREPFAIDIEGEQHWSGAVGCAVLRACRPAWASAPKSSGCTSGTSRLARQHRAPAAAPACQRLTRSQRTLCRRWWPAWS